MDSAPGSYAVILGNATHRLITVGRRGELGFEPGFYIYVGSAFGPGGIRSRVGRHSRHNKTLRWHIDYVREPMSLIEAWYSYRPRNQEHRWAAALQAQSNIVALRGIGCSDCDCDTHLFYSRHRPRFESLAVLLDPAMQRWPANRYTSTNSL